MERDTMEEGGGVGGEGTLGGREERTRGDRRGYKLRRDEEST